MKVNKMKPFMQVLDYNYGVKGTEIQFQDAIENYLEKQTGQSQCWWKYCTCQIFHATLNIYQECKSDECELLSRLSDLYWKIEEEVTGKANGTIPLDEEYDYLEFYDTELVEYLKKQKGEI